MVQKQAHADCPRVTKQEEGAGIFPPEGLPLTISSNSITIKKLVEKMMVLDFMIRSDKHQHTFWYTAIPIISWR